MAASGDLGSRNRMEANSSTRERSPRTRRERDRDQVLHQPSRATGEERKRDRTLQKDLRSRIDEVNSRGGTPVSSAEVTLNYVEDSRKRSYSGNHIYCSS